MQKYYRYVLDPGYDGPMPIERILNDIQMYDDKLESVKYNIEYSFREFCGDVKQSIVINYLDSGYIAGKHCHDFYEIIYSFCGEVIQRINNQSFVLHPGELLILHPSVAHSFYVYGYTKAINILVEKNYFERFISSVFAQSKTTCLYYITKENAFSFFSCETDYSFQPMIDKLCETANIREDIKRILGVKNLSTNSVADRLITEQLFQTLMLEIMKGVEENYIHQTRSVFSDRQKNNSEIITFIRENYSHVTLEEVSERFSYSKPQINRIIHTYTGNTFKTLIITLRIQRAKYYLSNTDYPITKIASLIGVQNSTYFTRFFKEVTGVTPTKYRSQSSKTGVT